MHAQRCLRGVNSALHLFAYS
jgi:hypothetical protein